MTAFDSLPDAAIAHAVVDSAGLLLSADPAIESLNAHAGGALGAAVAVPQLATLARLARRLGIMVSRSVTVADDDVDLELWVRAQPDAGHVRLAISGWREVKAWRPEAQAERRRIDLLNSDAEWRWETDAALRLTFVSIDAGARFGFDVFAVLGQPLTSLFTLDADNGGAMPILDALARRRALKAQPARLRGSSRAALLSAEVRHDNAGAFAGFAGGVRMIEPDGEVAPEPEALSSTFTTGLDKALRSPLAKIVANADSINAQADGPVRQDYADYAADIASAGRHLLGLVDDLVDLQMVERADFVVPGERIDLADVARRAAGLLSVRAANAGVTIVRPDMETTESAHGDFRRVLQILVNLIGNAVRYSPEGSAVTVCVSRADDHVVAMVADAGKGVAIEDQARIFEKFERIDTSEQGGNGLGLYIARRLARAMGGDLTVNSAAGDGARFTLTLPADAPRDQDQ